MKGSVPGDFKIGLDPIVGIPQAGDTAAAVVSLYLVAESARRAFRSTLNRMLANVGIDEVIGSGSPRRYLRRLLEGQQVEPETGLTDLAEASDDSDGRTGIGTHRLETDCCQSATAHPKGQSPLRRESITQSVRANRTRRTETLPSWASLRLYPSSMCWFAWVN